MIITPEIVRGIKMVPGQSKPKEPGGVRIALFVCGCHKNDKLIFITEKATQVARILGITLGQLGCFAVTAMLTGKPEAVACYKQRDVAEAKLSKLDVVGAFLSRPCHEFELLSE